MYDERPETLFFRDYRIKANVDTLPLKYLVGAGVVAATYLFIILIVALTGPHAHIQWDSYSFLCDGEVEVDYNDNCTGTNMNDSGDAGKQYLYLPPLDDEDYEMKQSNVQFSLQVWPYNKDYDIQDEKLKTDLLVHYQLFGTNEEHHSEQPDPDAKSSIWTFLHNKTETETLYCPREKARCYGFLLFLQKVIDFKYYSIMVEFLPSDGKDYVDNVLWVESTESQTFNDLQVGFRVTYFFISLALVILLIIPLRHKNLQDWPFEQRSMLLLAINICFFNNPLFGLELVSDSWIFPFMDSVFQVTFICILFMQWFFFLENIGSSEMKPLQWPMMLKAGVVLTYGILAITLASWMDMRFEADPAVGAGSISGIVALFYVTSCILGCLVVWLVVLAVMAVPRAFSERFLKIRFVFVALPASVVCFSMLIAIFSGTYGPYDGSTVSFLYFFSLFNVYVWLMVFGFFPSVSEMSSGLRANVEELRPNLEEISIINSNRDDAMALSEENAAASLAYVKH